MFSLRRYDWTLHMAAIAICSYFLAQAMTTYIGGVLESIPEGAVSGPLHPVSSKTSEETEKTTASLDDFKVIVERNIFNSAQSGVINEAASNEVSLEQLGQLGPAVKTNLDIKLLGTLVIGDGDDKRSSATILGSKDKGKADVYYPGDEKSFATNVKLMKVAKDRVEFINGGRLEYAEIEGFSAKKSIFASADEIHGKKEPLSKDEDKKKETPTVADASRIVIDQKEVDDALQNLDRLMTEIQIVPNFRGGKPAGMKVLMVKPGSIISKLGIKRGDVLVKVNGQDLDVQRGMELFSQMKDMRSFALDVERGGKNQTLEYEIR